MLTIINILKNMCIVQCAFCHWKYLQSTSKLLLTHGYTWKFIECINIDRRKEMENQWKNIHKKFRQKNKQQNPIILLKPEEFQC